MLKNIAVFWQDIPVEAQKAIVGISVIFTVLLTGIGIVAGLMTLFGIPLYAAMLLIICILFLSILIYFWFYSVGRSN